MIQEHYVISFKDAPKYTQPVDGGIRQFVTIKLENGRRKRGVKVAVVDTRSGFVRKFYHKGKRTNEQPINNFLPIKATEHSNVSYRHTVVIAVLLHEFGYETMRLVYDREEVAILFRSVGSPGHFPVAIMQAELFEAVVAAKQNMTIIKELEPQIRQQLAQDAIKATDKFFYRDVLGL